jgi:hypothetical protein
MPTFLCFKDGQPTPVAVQSNKSSTSARISADGLVERIKGADIALLKVVVQALSEKIQS